MMSVWKLRPFSMRYVPGGKLAKVYSPAPLVARSYRKFVQVLTAATFASAIVAFDGSFTRPAMEPFVVAPAARRDTKTNREPAAEGELCT